MGEGEEVSEPGTGGRTAQRCECALRYGFLLLANAGSGGHEVLREADVDTGDDLGAGRNLVTAEAEHRGVRLGTFIAHDRVVLASTREATV